MSFELSRLIYSREPKRICTKDSYKLTEIDTHAEDEDEHEEVDTGVREEGTEADTCIGKADQLEEVKGFDFSNDTDTGIRSVSVAFAYSFTLFNCDFSFLESIEIYLHSSPVLVSTLPSYYLEPFLGFLGFGVTFSSSFSLANEGKIILQIRQQFDLMLGETQLSLVMAEKARSSVV